MVLHSYAESKQFLIFFFFFIQADDLIKNRLVTYKASQLILIFSAPVIPVQKLIKAHLRIYLVAVPVMSVIGMHGNCIISLRFQNICHSILRSPDIQFIRNTARRKKRNTVSGKCLILRSCCSATVSGHMQTSICYIFINTVNIRQYFHI